MTGLDKDAVVTAGVELLQEEGWDRLSIRAVAGRLGVTPMALYRHVPNSNTLLGAVLARVAAPLAEVTDSGNLASDFEAWAHRAHDRLVGYPGAAGHILVTWFEVPPVLVAVDRLLAVAYASGLRDFEAVAAVNAVFTYVLMRAQAEQAVREADAVQRSLDLAVGEGTLTHLPRLAQHYTTARFDLHFEYGLRVLLNGIAGRIGHEGGR